MVEIGDTIVSFDLFEQQFCCDLDICKGQCCVEGDAGAPLEMDEIAKLEEVLPVIWNDLSEAARKVVDAQGVAYSDAEGDLVTSIVNRRECVFHTSILPKVFANAQLKRLTTKAKLHSTSQFRVICILFALKIQRFYSGYLSSLERVQLCRNKRT